MSSDTDDRVKRVVAKYAKKVEQDIQREKLNGLAGKERERRQADFLTAFLQQAHTVIQPTLERHAAEINNLSAERWSDDQEARRRAVSALVDRPNDDYEIELLLSREDRLVRLVFLADPQKLKVVVSIRGSVGDRSVPAQELDIEQVTDYNVGQAVADFLERHLLSF
jgi:hypothetical protein